MPAYFVAVAKILKSKGAVAVSTGDAAEKLKSINLVHENHLDILAKAITAAETSRGDPNVSIPNATIVGRDMVGRDTTNTSARDISNARDITFNYFGSSQSKSMQDRISRGDVASGEGTTTPACIPGFHVAIHTFAGTRLYPNGSLPDFSEFVTCGTYASLLHVFFLLDRQNAQHFPLHSWILLLQIVCSAFREPLALSILSLKTRQVFPCSFDGSIKVAVGVDEDSKLRKLIGLFHHDDDGLVCDAVFDLADEYFRCKYQEEKNRINIGSKGDAPENFFLETTHQSPGGILEEIMADIRLMVDRFDGLINDSKTISVDDLDDLFD